MKIYRIQNTKTGLYSRGGRYPYWNKKGKTWKINALKAHLRLVGSTYATVKDWVIHEYEVTETLTESKEAWDLLCEIKNKAFEKKAKALEKERQRIEAEERKRLAELKAKYEE